MKTLLRKLRLWLSNRQALINQCILSAEEVFELRKINVALNKSLGDSFAEMVSVRNEGVDIILALVLQNGGEARLEQTLLDTASSGAFTMVFDSNEDNSVLIVRAEPAPAPDVIVCDDKTAASQPKECSDCGGDQYAQPCPKCDKE